MITAFLEKGISFWSDCVNLIHSKERIHLKKKKFSFFKFALTFFNLVHTGFICFIGMYICFRRGLYPGALIYWCAYFSPNFNLKVNSKPLLYVNTLGFYAYLLLYLGFKLMGFETLRTQNLESRSKKSVLEKNLAKLEAILFIYWEYVFFYEYSGIRFFLIGEGALTKLYFFAPLTQSHKYYRISCKKNSFIFLGVKQNIIHGKTAKEKLIHYFYPILCPAILNPKYKSMCIGALTCSDRKFLTYSGQYFYRKKDSLLLEYENIFHALLDESNSLSFQFLCVYNIKDISLIWGFSKSLVYFLLYIINFSVFLVSWVKQTLLVRRLFESFKLKK